MTTRTLNHSKCHRDSLGNLGAYSHNRFTAPRLQSQSRWHGLQTSSFLGATCRWRVGSKCPPGSRILLELKMPTLLYIANPNNKSLVQIVDIIQRDIPQTFMLRRESSNTILGYYYRGTIGDTDAKIDYYDCYKRYPIQVSLDNRQDEDVIKRIADAISKVCGDVLHITSVSNESGVVYYRESQGNTLGSRVANRFDIE